MGKQATVDRNCPVCGTSYRANLGRLKFGRETTCSRDCSYRLRANKLENKVCCTCAVCGKQLARTPSNIKGKHGAEFCSAACHYAGRSTGATKRVVTRPYTISDEARAAWRAGAKKTRQIRKARDNYWHSEATRAKLAEATARALAEGKIPRVSKLEDKVAGELDGLGIRYERQRIFRDAAGRYRFVVDFFLPDYNAILEVNGSYWHADPRLYTGTLSATQSHNVRKYRTKVEALEALGFQVVEVWEKDFKEAATKAVFEAYSQLIAR